MFINSHPHNDHLCGLDKLREAVTIDAIWHSGRVPSANHQEVYDLLQDESAGYFAEVFDFDWDAARRPDDVARDRQELAAMEALGEALYEDVDPAGQV